MLENIGFKVYIIFSIENQNGSLKFELKELYKGLCIHTVQFLLSGMYCTTVKRVMSKVMTVPRN